MEPIQLRAMRENEWGEVATLICESTNQWYESHGRAKIFTGGPTSTRLFCEVYEALDPGCCVVAEDTKRRQIVGSCFYHPRSTHMSLGIMNVHPKHFGRGIARKLLKFITDYADARSLPVRLVSSAMNLDSFSLYTRAGFVPRRVFADMYIPVPQQGHTPSVPLMDRVREARLSDARALAELETQISHIEREKDYRFFLENKQGIWHASVIEGADGKLDGFLVSVAHPGSNMLGPGVARTQQGAAALILAELQHHRGRAPVFLVPMDCDELVSAMYACGAKNCEIHFAQVRGRFDGFDGVVMPTFMPETG